MPLQGARKPTLERTSKIFCFWLRWQRCTWYIFFLFLFHTPTLQFLDKQSVTGVVPSSPRFLPSVFIVHRVQQSHCSSIFSSSVANSRCRAFRKSICAREKVPTRSYEYALGGIRTHDKLTHTRLEDDLIRHRGDRLDVRWRRRIAAGSWWWGNCGDQGVNQKSKLIQQWISNILLQSWPVRYHFSALCISPINRNACS